MEYSHFLTAPLSLTAAGTQVHASDSSRDTISTAPYENNNARQRAARVQSAPNPPPVLHVYIPTVSVVLPNHAATFLMQYPCVGVRSKVAITTREYQRMNEAMEKKRKKPLNRGVFLILKKKSGARGTRRAAARHSQAARVHTNFVTCGGSGGPAASIRQKKGKLEFKKKKESRLCQVEGPDME